MLRRTAVVFAALLLTSCSVKKYAIHTLGDALAASGATFASDDDPDLIRAAVPFSLKLIETLLAENPRQQGLLLAAARGFTQYAFAFVQEDADEAEDTGRAAAAALRARAAKLYFRARNYGLRGLEVKHPDFAARLGAHPKEAAKELKKSEVPVMYWTALSWAAALAASHDMMMMPEIPRFEALTDRVLQLDEAYEGGVIHTFLIAYEMSRLNPRSDRFALAKGHFERAVALGEGRQAGPLVVYAENVLVAQKDKTGFQNMLRQALKLNVNASPANRQLNLAMQRRARWLLGRTDKLFPN